MLRRKNNGISFCSAVLYASLLSHFTTCLNSGIAQERPGQSDKKPIDYPFIIARFKQQVPGLLKQMNVPGLAIAMVDGEKVVWADGFGHTDRSNKTPVTADTLFSIQSISKTYTATGFLMAVEKGSLKLDDPLKKYLPRFTINSRFGTSEVNKITFRHLLSHWAGLPHEAPCGNNYDDTPCSFEEHIKSISDSWLRFPVGKAHSYSNLGIDLAGYALQVRSRKPFERLMKEVLFEPLGMTASTFSENEARQNGSRALGYDGDREIAQHKAPIIPSGGMFSTVNDMARFVSFHLSGGKVAGKRLVSEKLLQELSAPQFPVDGQVGGYGLGIAIEPWRGGTILYHGGSSWYGYSASQRWMPEYRVGVVVLTNSAQGNVLADALANRALQLMIEAKGGAAPPPTQPLILTDKPVIALSNEQLQQLEGTYKPQGSVATFKIENGSLFYLSGSDRVKLDARSATEFTAADLKLTFTLNGSGRADGVYSLRRSGVEFLPLNDFPSEAVGPNKPSWQEFVGEYIGSSYGHAFTVSLSVKNGYLYLIWQGGQKLTEAGPGLFFTPDGETVEFRREKMLLGNRSFRKRKSS